MVQSKTEWWCDWWKKLQHTTTQQRSLCVQRRPEDTCFNYWSLSGASRSAAHRYPPLISGCPRLSSGVLLLISFPGTLKLCISAVVCPHSCWRLLIVSELANSFSFCLVIRAITDSRYSLHPEVSAVLCTLTPSGHVSHTSPSATLFGFLKMMFSCFLFFCTLSLQSNYSAYFGRYKTDQFI